MFAKKEQKKPGAFGLLATVLVSLASAVVLLGPGMLVVAAARSTMDKELAVEPMWIGAVATSVALFALVWWRTSPPRKSGQASRLVVAWRTYFFLSVTTVAALAACRYAFDMTFPETYLAYYTGGDPVATVSALLGKTPG